MSNKLSEENKMKVINNEIEDCTSFIQHIKSIQQNNSAFLWSQPAPPPNKTHSHMAQTMPPGASAIRGARQTSQVICHICETKDQHKTYACPTFKPPKSDKDLKALVDICKKKRVCTDCLGLQNTDGSHSCPSGGRRFYCNKHRVSRNLCKCTRSHI